MSFKNWMNENLDIDQLTDIVRDGVRCGIKGLIYTCDIMEVFENEGHEIYRAVSEYADKMGFTNPTGLACALNEDFGSGVDFETWMVWTAVEYLAQDVLDEKERVA